MEDFIMNGMLYRVGHAPVSANPNNCSTCRFKQMHNDPKGSTWCYMFRHEPIEVCAKHSGNELLK